jgi:DNA-3-methyladenine glycosylase
VARDLVGRVLVSRVEGQDVRGRISEVEAYLGPRDRACHTWHGRRTARVESMYGDAGRAYVYLIYGLHRCLNVVTVGGGAGEAVLIRGIRIECGLETARQRRGRSETPDRLADGPGKLTQALDVGLEHDGLDLTHHCGPLWIAAEQRLLRGAVQQTPRIGIPNAGRALHWKLRWVDVSPQSPHRGS